MKTITADEARDNLGELLEQTAASHEPFLIQGKGMGGALLSEDDWRAIEETIYLLSVPGMRDSMRTGMQVPLEECSSELEW